MGECGFPLAEEIWLTLTPVACGQVSGPFYGFDSLEAVARLRFCEVVYGFHDILDFDSRHDVLRVAWELEAEVEVATASIAGLNVGDTRAAGTPA